MRDPPTINELPPRLLKAYTQLEHARALVERGVVRLGALRYYRAIENASRRDVDEGEARLQIPGDIPEVTLDAHSMRVIGETRRPSHFNWSSSFVNATYAFCASASDVSLAHLKTFGSFTVEVLDPAAFLHALKSAVMEAAARLGHEVVFIDAFAVRYDKGEVGEHPYGSDTRLRLDYGQKARCFAMDREHRVVVALSSAAADAPDFVDLQIVDADRFVRMGAAFAEGAT